MKVLILNGSPRVDGNTAIAVNEMRKVFADEGIETPTLTLAVPNRFISHATIAQQLAVCGLDSFGISRRIETRFRQITGAGR